jgi:hypothetical protein
MLGTAEQMLLRPFLGRGREIAAPEPEPATATATAA